VKISRCNLFKITMLIINSVIAVILVLLITFPVNAGNKPLKVSKSSRGKKIYVSSDKLISNSKTNTAEFIGNVVVKQGNTIINSDSLKLYFYLKKQSGNEESIKKIVAYGHVKIMIDGKIATSKSAVYTVKNRILVLSGPGSKIISGDNSISGSKITLHRDGGRITVDGGGSRRVEAIFSPGDNSGI